MHKLAWVRRFWVRITPPPPNEKFVREKLCAEYWCVETNRCVPHGYFLVHLVNHLKGHYLLCSSIQKLQQFMADKARSLVAKMLFMIISLKDRHLINFTQLSSIVITAGVASRAKVMSSQTSVCPSQRGEVTPNASWKGHMVTQGWSGLG